MAKRPLGLTSLTPSLSYFPLQPHFPFSIFADNTPPARPDPSPNFLYPLPTMPSKATPLTPSKTKKRKDRAPSAFTGALFPASPLADGQLPGTALAPLVEGSISVRSPGPSTPPPTTIDMKSLGQCSPLGATAMGRVSCHVLVTTHGAMHPVLPPRTTSAVTSHAPSAQSTPHAVRFVGEDIDGTMAGFRLEFPTKREAELALEIVKKARTLLVAGVRSAAVREPNHKTLMTRSFYAPHTKPAEVTVAAMPVDRPLCEFVLKEASDVASFTGGINDTRNGRVSLLCVVMSAARSFSANGHPSRDLVVMAEDGNDLPISLMKHHARMELTQRPGNKRPILHVEGAMVDDSGRLVVIESSVVTCNEPANWPPASKSDLFSRLPTNAKADLSVAVSDMDTFRDPTKAPPTTTPAHHHC